MVVCLFQEKNNKIAQELTAHQQQMRTGGSSLSQGTRRILQERQRHTMKASQAAAAMAASGLLNQVCLRPAVLCCNMLCYAMLTSSSLCYPVLQSVVLCAVLCCAHAVFCALLCCTMPRYAMPCCAALCYAALH